MKRLRIGGVGNVLNGDDGVGPYVVRLIEARYEFPDDVEVADLGTPGLDLVVHLSGAEALILIDAVENRAAPGTITLYRRSDIVLHGPAIRLDPHSPALTESLLIAEMAGGAPAELLLIGITAASCGDGCQLSEPVRNAVDRVIASVLREVERLGIRYRLKEKPSEPAIWWNELQAIEPAMAD